MFPGASADPRELRDIKAAKRGGFDVYDLKTACCGAASALSPRNWFLNRIIFEENIEGYWAPIKMICYFWWELLWLNMG